MTRPPDSPDPLLGTVRRVLDRHAPIPPGAGVLVGVSGGMDSIALLHVLVRLAGEPGRGWRITAGHLDHGLRPGSAEDAAFVAEFAAGLGVVLVSERRDSAGRPLPNEGPEAAARRVRYEFFRDVAERVGADCVALAHHADDNAETVLHRIVRGTHLRGLAGIPLRRPLGPAEGGIEVVRPFLECPRGEIRDYCRLYGLWWREDPTNAETTFGRNFLRHEVLPLLRRGMNPGVDQALLRLARAAGEADAVLARLAGEALAEATVPDAPGRVVLDSAVLERCEPALRRYVVHEAMERAGAPMRTVDARLLAHLADAIARPDAMDVHLPGGLRMFRQAGRVRIVPRRADDPEPEIGETPLTVPGRTALPDGRNVVCEVVAYDPVAFGKHCLRPRRWEKWLDADELVDSLHCRTRRDGDAFRPLGAPGRQSVSDLLTNAKVPPAERAGVLCILDAAGIICAAPLRIAHRVRVTPETLRVLRVRVEPPGYHEG